MSIYETLSHIQVELKSPKNLYNSFGRYKYRNAESILEAAKPLCAKYGCTLTVSDEVILIGSRYYIKATATVQDKDGNAASATALAREDETKKGMDGAQITGTASSYSRKYALNGLFCIDDTKDPDSDEYHNQTTESNQPVTASPEVTAQVVKDMATTALKGYAQRTGKDNKTVQTEAKTFIGKLFKDFTDDDWRSVAKEFEHRK
ncbi:MAG: ERF family protein [Subdoligranulum variabile]|nr:ERF family protein [Subdoligranulum variabile]